MQSFKISIAKIGENVANEDAATAGDGMIAISDGAGGGGIYAEYWSRHLLNKLPKEPITTFSKLNEWIDGIWEPFYNDYEVKAKIQGGMFLNKFYDEGSFATLVAVWLDGNKALWCRYGDSVAFHYNYRTKILEHSFTKLVDFNNSPYLINYNHELKEQGFRAGEFVMDKDSIVFVASDALSHYITMMYYVANLPQYRGDIDDALSAQTKNSNFINVALSMKNIDFEKDVIDYLINNTDNSHSESKFIDKDMLVNEADYTKHLQLLNNEGLLAVDDYSLAVITL